MNLLWQQKLCNLQQLKIAIFTYRSPHFCFPWRRPCDYHAICCMDGKTIQCLPNPGTRRSTYLSIFNSFWVIRCLSQCVSPKIAILPHFCFSWGRPWGNHARYGWKENSMLIYIQIVSQHVPIYLQHFSSYSNRKCKKTPFSRTAAHIFVSPGDGSATITQYVAWMERQFNACQSLRHMYLSIFNSFRVIRCLSQCVSPKIAIFTTFLFPLGTPLGQSR